MNTADKNKSEVKLNPEQLHAVNCSKDLIVVSAGAGSGKTKVLSLRYMRLLNERMQKGGAPKNIITLTYTDKAAGEMRERILDMLNHDARLRSEVLSAPIGTIHSFCNSLLQKFSLRLGLDPRYRVISEIEANSLKNKAAASAITKAIKDKKYGKQIFNFLIENRRDAVRDQLFSVHKPMQSLGYKPSDIKFYDTLNFEKIRQQVGTLIENGNSFKWSPAAGKNFAQIYELYSKAAASNLSYGEYLSFLIEISPFLSAIRAGSNEEIKNYKDDLKESITKAAGVLVDIITENDLHSFSKLLEYYYNEYQIIKESMSALDYTDQLLYTKELLSGKYPDVNKYIQTTHTHILVDEFQDVSPLQYSIIKLLAKDMPLFVVGDIKQSIFRFQGSDVALMTKEEEMADQSAYGKRISLMTNYRSNERLLNVVNHFFNSLWTDNTDFKYEKLRSGREIETPVNQEQDIEVFFLNSANDYNRKDEAKLIANRILQLKKENGYNYSDIMILFSKKSNMKIFENALNSAGIPSTTIGQSGFFSRSDISSVADVISLALNPYDNYYAALSILSDIVGCNEETLWLIKHGNKNIWDSVKNIENNEVISLSDKEKIIALRELIEKIQDNPFIHPKNAVEIIIKELKLKTASMYGKEGVLNLNKLLTVADELYNTKHAGLPEFRDFLLEQRTILDDEPYASVNNEGDDAVRLITIHKSKGLESPVIFLVEAGSGTGGNGTNFFLNNDGYLVFKGNFDETIFTKKINSYNYNNAVERDKAALLREKERLLYVAMTRAEKKLIITGVKNKNGSGHYIKLISEILTGEENGAISLEKEIKKYDERLIIKSLPQIENILSVNLHNNKETFKEVFHKEIENYRLPTVKIKAEEIEKYEELLADITSNEAQYPLVHQPKRIGVSKLLLLNRCPYSYYLETYSAFEKEGYSNDDESTLDEIKNDTNCPNESFSNVEFGNMFHSVMEKIDFSKDIFGAQIDELIKNAEVPKKYITSLHNALNAFSRLPLMDEILNADKIYKELKFLYPRGEIYIAGSIDLLMLKNGRAKVVDYKTGKPSINHRQQLMLYSLALPEIDSADIIYLSESSAKIESMEITEGMRLEAARLIENGKEYIKNNNYPKIKSDFCGFCKKCDNFLDKNS